MLCIFRQRHMSHLYCKSTTTVPGLLEGVPKTFSQTESNSRRLEKAPIETCLQSSTLGTQRDAPGMWRDWQINSPPLFFIPQIQPPRLVLSSLWWPAMEPCQDKRFQAPAIDDSGRRSILPSLAKCLCNSRAEFEKQQSPCRLRQ